VLNLTPPTQEPIILSSPENECGDTDGRQLQRASTGAKQEVRRLVRGEEALALEHLNNRPLENVMMTGLIHDHGLESAHNRGNFYGHYSGDQLTGMALLGHCVLLSGDPRTAVSFAHVARRYYKSTICIMLAGEIASNKFSQALMKRSSGLVVHKSTSQLLLVLENPVRPFKSGSGLRTARLNEAHDVSRMNASAYLEMNGVDPATRDPIGFHERVCTRIERERVWILRDEKGIAFKVDVVSMTDQVMYLEGVLTRSDLRGTGIGSMALSDLCHRLLQRHKAVCVLTESENQRTLSFYHRIGFAPIAPFRFVRYKQTNNLLNSK
jgi:predicted GNAT family acetyltransferase